MPDNPQADCQRVLAFTGGRANPDQPVEPALREIFPKANLTLIDPTQTANLLCAQDDAPVDWAKAIAWLRQQNFDAALILTQPGQSPYTLGYLCYLAGIPIRIGQSCEFGGQVLNGGEAIRR